jgi:hypothetical protein
MKKNDKVFWVCAEYHGLTCSALEAHMKKVVGKDYSSNGFCFGNQKSDVTWEFFDKKKATAAVKKLKKMKIEVSLQEA